MKEQSFDNDVNSLTGMSNSNSGAPSAIDEQAPTDAFERSWDWDFEVRELGPDETAECKVTMGADDLANLTVDGEERLDIGRADSTEAAATSRRRLLSALSPECIGHMWTIAIFPFPMPITTLPNSPLT